MPWIRIVCGSVLGGSNQSNQLIFIFAISMFHKAFKKMRTGWALVVHVFNPSVQEPEAGSSLYVFHKKNDLPECIHPPGNESVKKRSPSVSRDQNRRYDQSEEREEYSQYVPSDSTMPRSPSDYADRRPQREPQFYEEPDHLNYRDSNRRAHRHSKEYIVDDEDVESRDEYERQRREEEYQARYRSDPNLARYPVKPQPYEEQMRIHAEVSRARHERRHSDVSLANAELEDSRISLLRMDRPSRQRSVSERRAAMENQRSYSMERTREAQGPSSYPQRTTNHSPPTPRRSPIPVDRLDMRRADSLRKQHHLDPSSAVRKTKREKMETMLRNDSLSSDQSESVRPPPPKPHKSKKGGKMRQVSLSSSEEELASTPEYTSCDDVEIESESVSEKGDSQKGKRKTSEQGVLSDSNTRSERQKKRMYFGGHSLEEDLEWSEPQIKDSGVDTCSSTTLNEEHSHSDKHPVTWQPSKDGDRLIGRILLNKRLKDGSVPRDSGAMLGLKVVGGKMTESGRLCAFITKVKKGSLADTVGHLRPGDEVLEWNGRLLQGATFEEVYNIILESKPEPQVELVVSRPIGDIPRIPDSTHAQLESSSSSFESQKMDRPSISVTSPMSPGMLRDVPQFLSGQLSIKLWFDKVGHQLIVTILGAKDLPSREDGRPRNPYVKIYFLPDRSDKNKRRTKTVKKTLEPKWNQTFIYSPVHRREFRERMLEITLWDQARVREEESEFLGEILIELETALLDDEPHWYKLQTHDVSSLPLPHPSPYLPRRQLHGESPTRRLQRSKRVSDSEVSDYDCDDGVGVASDYRHNGRDLQSSTLSVPEQVMSSNHCSPSGSPHRVDVIGRTRSWSPSVPPPQRSHPRTGSVQTSPSSTPVTGRRGRQLPQLPPKGTLERKVCSSFSLKKNMTLQPMHFSCFEVPPILNVIHPSRSWQLFYGWNSVRWFSRSKSNTIKDRKALLSESIAHATKLTPLGWIGGLGPLFSVSLSMQCAEPGSACAGATLQLLKTSICLCQFFSVIVFLSIKLCIEQILYIVIYQEDKRLNHILKIFLSHFSFFFSFFKIILWRKCYHLSLTSIRLVFSAN
ncbi:Rims2 [Phodopus roborovskii]|uniref:Rims2 protein n=1 Tax=Phodopus roborovskii TaxID=109678 RepID=A0AAV0A3S3_PHORO|nr:Rims2 [Phodopus roborovskii]